MKGHGVVVTGTAVAGHVAPGDTVRILPGGEEARVRTVQVHGREVPRGERGQRVALNLAGVEKTEVGRGHVVVHTSITSTTVQFDALVEIRPLAKKPVATRRRVRLHIGTAEVLARLVVLGGGAELAPRSRGHAQIVCEEPIVAFRGDRFILRSESADRTLGGGRVIHPFAPRHRARDSAVPAALEQVESADPVAAAVALLEMDRDFARPLAWLAEALDVEESSLAPLVTRDGIEALPRPATAEAVTIRAKWDRWLDALLATLAAHHRDHPLLPGMEMESLRGQLPYPVGTKLFREIVDRLVAEKKLAREENLVHLPAHKVAMKHEERTLTDHIEALVARGGFTPPDLKQMAETLKLPANRVQELLAALEREGRVAKVSQDLYYHATEIAKLRDLVADRIRTAGQLGAAEFRDTIQASRKFSIALLEYFDRTGFTIRVGDLRKLRKG
jgi:selenocysteine-specific elongation factor